MLVDIAVVRRETLEALVEHLAEEHLTIEEFDRRVKTAKEASGPTGVRAALDGLPGRGSSGSG